MTPCPALLSAEWEGRVNVLRCCVRMLHFLPAQSTAPGISSFVLPFLAYVFSPSTNTELSQQTLSSVNKYSVSTHHVQALGPFSLFSLSFLVTVFWAQSLKGLRHSLGSCDRREGLPIPRPLTFSGRNL